MLYHVTFHTDHQALGFAEQRRRVIDDELQRASEVQQEGRLIGLWARADPGGAIFILDAESHEKLMLELQSLPIFPYLRSIDVIPLVTHPRFPEFGVGRGPADQAAAL